MDDFESFTREKIARLRSDADALEKVLKEYLGVKARASGPTRRSGAGGPPRSGAFGVILTALSFAGAEGMTLDDMIETAAASGYDVKRNTLRSQLWQAKADGEVEQIKPGLYRVPGAEELTKGRIQFPDDESPGQYGGGFSSPPRRAPAEDSKGVQLATAVIPKEDGPDFSADLDDEIPF